MIEVSYDFVGHYFMCDGHVDEQEFLEALWEQWDTDYCRANVGKTGVYHSFARFVRGNPGYWKEAQNSGSGSKPVTIILGSVVGLGPMHCMTCDMLMSLDTKTIDSEYEEEHWSCPNCRTTVDITKPR